MATSERDSPRAMGIHRDTQGPGDTNLVTNLDTHGVTQAGSHKDTSGVLVLGHKNRHT